MEDGDYNVKCALGSLVKCGRGFLGVYGAGYYRSLGYMRPLCIWAMQWALTGGAEGQRHGGQADEEEHLPTRDLSLSL